MMSDEFALEQFKKVYGHLFVEVKLQHHATGASEIVGCYNKPRFKEDWIPKKFCRRPVHCIRVGHEQAATPTPPVALKAQ